MHDNCLKLTLWKDEVLGGSGAGVGARETKVLVVKVYGYLQQVRRLGFVD